MRISCQQRHAKTVALEEHLIESAAKIEVGLSQRNM
jgi:hypothetical protein